MRDFKRSKKGISFKMYDEDRKYDNLKLKKQLCFPLYAVTNLITKKYKDYLIKLNLSFTQYITMMALWEEGCLTMGELTQKLFLGSSTVSPVLQRLEEKEYVEKCFLEEDERVTVVMLTDKGKALKDEALKIPQEMKKYFSLEDEEEEELHRILYKILEREEKSKKR